MIDQSLVESDASGEVTTRDVPDAELGALLWRFGIVLAPEELDLLRPPGPKRPSGA